MTVVYSASSVNAYLDCQLRWWFAYVAAIETEPSEPQATGIAVHEAAEGILQRHQQGPPASLNHVEAVVGPEPINDLVRVFLRDILPTYGQIIAVEREFQITVGGIPFGGTYDSIDGHEGPYDLPYLILRDLKTTGSRPAKGKYRFNMIGYFLGAQSDGIEVNEMRLDYIVRTRSPYYWPETQQVPDEDELDGWFATLERVADGVERGEFAPTGLGTYVCSYCNFKSECGPYQRLASVSPLREESK